MPIFGITCSPWIVGGRRVPFWQRAFAAHRSPRRMHESVVAAAAAVMPSNDGMVIAKEAAAKAGGVETLAGEMGSLAIVDDSPPAAKHADAEPQEPRDEDGDDQTQEEGEAKDGDEQPARTGRGYRKNDNPPHCRYMMVQILPHSSRVRSQQLPLTREQCA